MKDAQQRIQELKEEKDVVLLVHNYQRPEIQDVADFLGDSFGLSLDAKKAEQENIVFCGVDFMAESAKILNPNKRVVHPIVKPHLLARCPMAAMVDAESLRLLKEKHPDASVVSYVNTSAEVKALSDYCCTSANAVNVVKSVPEKKVIFVPDQNLGLYVQRFVKDKEMILWPGYCRTHVWISLDDLRELKKAHPDAKVMVHPECVPEVIDFADHVASTEGMVRYVASSNSKEFIVGTEKELAYRLKKKNPEKEFYTTKKAVCPNMKQIKIENVVSSMESLQPEVKLKKDIIEKARIPLERMMEIGRGD